MSLRIRQLREQRAQIATQMRGILETAERESRALSAEEQTNYDTAFASQGELRSTIDRLERQAELDTELGTSVQETRGDRNGEDPEPTPRGRADAGEDEYEARALRDGVTLSSAVLERRRARQALVSADPRSRPEARKAWAQFLSAGFGGMSREQRATLQAGIDNLGGFTVAPAQFVAGLLQRVDDTVLMRQLATVRTVGAAQELGVLTLDDDVDDADWTSELATGSDTDLTFGKRMARPHPLAKRIKVSKTLLRAPGLDIEALIRDRFAYKFGVTEEKAFLVGDGVGKPLGVFTASADGIPTSRDLATGNTAAGMTFDGLLAAKYSLKDAYRRNARWLFHRDGILQLSMLKDGENRYIWQPSVVAGTPDRILNLPIAESEHVPNVYTANKYVGILGDFSFYWIVDALSMQLQRLDELYAETNRVGFIARKETDGQPVMAEAFTRIKLGA